MKTVTIYVTGSKKIKWSSTSNKERLRLSYSELQKESTFKERNLNSLLKETCINNSFSYKYLGVDLDPNLSLTSYFDKTYKRAAGIVNLLRSIRPSIDQKCAETIYNTMILPIFTCCRSLNLGSSDTQKSLIRNIEQWSLRIWQQ